ncbi:hypothetical protein ACN077_20800 [Clostridium chromiireducens]|uniref:hypothetical protein n=1 Tax=Clostridium chromiireducens TaxID=225345 RepID=UPI003AF62975
MRVDFLGIRGSWKDVLNSARTTINMEHGDKEPSSNWKRRMLLAEHSPIRLISIKWKWFDLKYWVSTHFVRHWLGIEHYVRTQRTDRAGIERDDLGQGSLVEHEAQANAQALINISRKRLCSCASVDTRIAWKEFLYSFKDQEPELYNVCVPDCIYRGHCYEHKTCGYHKTEQYQEQLKAYRQGIN